MTIVFRITVHQEVLFTIKAKACNHPICRLLAFFDIGLSGEGGIRTLGTVSRTSV